MAHGNLSRVFAALLIYGLQQVSPGGEPSQTLSQGCMLAIYAFNVTASPVKAEKGHTRVLTVFTACLSVDGAHQPSGRVIRRPLG